MKPPRLTDPVALMRNRMRTGANSANFIRREAAEILQERLIEVNRTFTAPAVVTPFPNDFEGLFENSKRVDATESLHLQSQAHDVVVHAMGMHWANDPLGQIIQCSRALVPDGLFIAFLFGGATLHELRTCLAEAEALETGGLSPRVAPMADIKDLGALLQRAGLALPVADSFKLEVSYNDIFALGRDLRLMGEGNALEGRLRHPSRRRVFEQAGKIYKSNFPAPEGRIRATFELVFLTGWSPDESQPKPLRPGSAKTSLARALAVPPFPSDPENHDGSD